MTSQSLPTKQKKKNVPVSSFVVKCWKCTKFVVRLVSVDGVLPVLSHTCVANTTDSVRHMQGTSRRAKMLLCYYWTVHCVRFGEDM